MRQPSGNALKNQRENSAELIGIVLQMPAAQDKCGIIPQRPHLHFRKIEMPHGLLIRVVFPVAVQNRLPTTGDSAAAREGNIW